MQNKKKLQKKKISIKEKHIKAILILVFLLVIGITAGLLFTGHLFRDRIPANGTTFLFLPVGQANCTLIFTENGVVMIDTGSNASEETLSAALRHYHAKKIDLLILSHADEDHSGGLDLVLQECSVSEVMLTIGTYRALTETYGGSVLNEAVKSGRTTLSIASAGDTKRVGALELEVLTPSNGDEEITEGGNESSLILLLRYGETEAIFPGDADSDGELRALKALKMRDVPITCDLLLVGHHGSSSSSSQEFIEYLKPDYAVISCGRDNSYGHPTSTVLDRLQAAGTTVYRTDLNGTILLYSDGTSIVKIK